MFKRRSRKETRNPYADNRKGDEFVRVGGIKGVIVDEQGLDVFYWKRLHDTPPFLGGNSSTSHLQNYTKTQTQTLPVVYPPLKQVKNKQLIIKSQSSVKCSQPSHAQSLLNAAAAATTPLPPPPAARPLPNAPPPAAARPLFQPLPNAAVAAAVPPLQLPPGAATRPALPRSNAPPLPPPPSLIVERKHGIPPPPLPPKTSVLTSPSRQPTQKDNLSLSNDNQLKFIPLHWDKVNTNLGRSMVWHKLHNGSFRVDDDKMASFFGTMTIDKKTPQKENIKSLCPNSQMKSGPTRVFLLDTRKSQNIAIVVKSLSISKSKIIDCILQGKNLDTDTLEKLARINLSKQEVQTILDFEDDTMKLADAEIFLSHILKAVPLAFTRVNIMLFKSNYRSEVTEVKKCLQTLDMACKEVKTQGLFVKLLEAVLKAGNRMNVGTARGDAKAFNLKSLLKLSDVKSSDGKTTLLHFVVEEVIRAEGKRCNIKRNQSSDRGTTCSISGETYTDSYYIKLGLPAVGGVSWTFSNVKKAAGIDYDGLKKSCLELSVHLTEITKTMEEVEQEETGGGFVREMETFLEGAKREIDELREEERRIMGVVKLTNEYYEAGSSTGGGGGGQQLQLFVIIKGFLDMVDKACLDIAIKMQKRSSTGGSTGRSPMNFLANFTSSSSSSSDSDESIIA